MADREKNTEKRTLRFFHRLLKERLPVYNVGMYRAAEIEVNVKKSRTEVFCYYAWFPFGKTYIKIVSADTTDHYRQFYSFEKAFQHFKRMILKKVKDVEALSNT